MEEPVEADESETISGYYEAVDAANRKIARNDLRTQAAEERMQKAFKRYKQIRRAYQLQQQANRAIERKNRTHRLIVQGAILQQHLVGRDLSDEELKKLPQLLESVFQMPDVAEKVRETLSQNDSPQESAPAEQQNDASAVPNLF